MLVCQYDKVKASGYQWDQTVARFKGHDVIANWTCPEWFPVEICDSVTKVWSGQARYWPQSGAAFSVDQEIVVAEWNGQKIMFQYWTDQFACPWFRSFGEARAANPGGNFDCLVP